MNIGIKVFLSTSALSRIIFFIEYASLKKNADSQSSEKSM